MTIQWVDCDNCFFIFVSSKQSKIKTISILVPKTAVTAAVVDSQYIFTAVNQFFTNEGKALPFKVHLVVLQKGCF